jgi:cysteine sulfinate desulfinase/cysteine desulfurase-like protein
VLISSGVSFYLAQRTIRFSTGRDATKKDINNVIDELKVAVNKLLAKEENN